MTGKINPEIPYISPSYLAAKQEYVFFGGEKSVGSPQVLAGKCVSNLRFEGEYHMSNYSLGFKKLF